MEVYGFIRSPVDERAAAGEDAESFQDGSTFSIPSP